MTLYSGTPLDKNKELSSFAVRYELHIEFRRKVELLLTDCKIINVIEIKSNEVIEYWIEYKKEQDRLISDLAFMTWVRNPVFQKHYHHTESFAKIAEGYILENLIQK